jgi:hypothetical protein
MIDTSQIAGPLSAFVAGLVTSLHCVGMCGPLACLLVPRAGDRAEFATVAGIYQATRIFSYTLVGALAGGLGMIGLAWTDHYHASLVRFLPWALVLFFLLVALDAGRLVPAAGGAAGRPGGSWLQRMQLRASRLPRPVAAATVGLLTPFLPCAPLYGVFWLALMTQSPARGAEFLLAFALGTLPLLWLAQSQYMRLQARLGPRTLRIIQRVVALLAALIIGYRLYLLETSEGGLFCVRMALARHP